MQTQTTFTPTASFLTGTTDEYIMQQIIDEIPAIIWKSSEAQYNSFIEGYITDNFDSCLSSDETDDVRDECWLLRHRKHPNLELKNSETVL